MASSGSGADATVLRSGMATVKPISAIMPRTTERPSPHSTPRGTLRTGLTASSDMSAASSNPTRVKTPSRLASAMEYQVVEGVVAEVGVVRRRDPGRPGRAPWRGAVVGALRDQDLAAPGLRA